MIGALTSFGVASVRIASPLACAALGETVAEKCGLLNLGIEGAMLAGAFSAAAFATHGGIAAGVSAAVVAGMLVSALFAGAVVVGRADQVIAGMAITIGITGLTGVLAQRVWGPLGAGLSVPMMRNVALPGLSSIPAIGPLFFDQPAITYATYVAIPVTTWMLFSTRFGLRLRAIGESPAAAGQPA